MIDPEISSLLQKFATERDWDQFHTPKNLATSIAIESSELLEIFQWSRGQNNWEDLSDPNIRDKVENELADVLLYLIRFADLAKIDLNKAAIKKIALNAEKYPIEKFKGSDKKYNE